MSGFAPVHLPDDRKLNGRLSQTMLRHYSACPRSGYLYALTRGELRTAEMERGKAVHAINERSIRLAMEQGEPTIPPEVVKVIVDEVFADPGFHVPVEEHDYVREAAYRFASEWIFDPNAVVALETLFSMDVGGYQVRCKIDYAEISENGATVVVRDWKSARGAPSFEEIARKLKDGRLMAKNFQLVLYALALAFGVPVRVEEQRCVVCAGHGWMADADPRTGEAVNPEPCEACRGTGVERVEIPEPFPVAGRANLFQLEFVYPGIEDREGKMVRRPVTLTRPELDQYRASLEGLVARVRHSEGSGDWPAVVSDSACGECPAAGLCPIPAELRDHRGTVNTADECADALSVRHREKAVSRAKVKEIREAVKRLGPVRFGDGMVAEIGFTESERIADKDAMWAALERTRRYGDPFERHRYVKSVESFPLIERALTAEELAESEGSNGSEQSSDPDERWGADAPY